jgi:hypothetical protein
MLGAKPELIAVGFTAGDKLIFCYIEGFSNFVPVLHLMIIIDDYSGRLKITR